MPDFLISYDLENQDPDPHKLFLTAAEKEGLLYVWKGTNYVSRLPNTTVWGEFDTLEEANTAFERALVTVASKLGSQVNLEKRVTTRMGAGNVASDRRKKPEAKWTGKSDFQTSQLHQVNDPFFK